MENKKNLEALLLAKEKHLHRFTQMGGSVIIVGEKQK